MSNIPYITTEQVVKYLQDVCDHLDPLVEVSDLYPSDDSNVPYGVYVSSVGYENREPYQLGIQQCGSIYIANDSFDILLVITQNDLQGDIIEDAITNLASNGDFFDGYHEVTFTSETTIATGKSKKVTYTFNLKRLNFID